MFCGKSEGNHFVSDMWSEIMNRRAFIGTAGTALTAGFAGCNGLRSQGEVVEQERTVTLTKTELSASELRDVVAESRNTYESSGVWGIEETEPAHELAYHGAWTATLDHEDGIRSDHLLLAYELPPTPDGIASSQIWLWSGVNPAGAKRVRRIETGISLPSDDTALGIYSPAQDFSADETDGYDVQCGRLDVETLETRMPLSSGEVGVGNETRIGDGGAYFPYWRGDGETTQSLAATTDVRWPKETDGELNWTIAVETA